MAKEETDILKSIEEFLELKGFYVIRKNNGAHKVGGGRRGKPSKKSVGVSDILAVSPQGIFFAVEAKKPGGKASVEQIAFIEEVNKRGGRGIIAYSLVDVINFLTV